ncbi:Glycoside hydrolase family 17 protein [Dioscorea alata]|nr:Glycoside hydrolase family 17 protein [Dioscorea alata]KAH7661837.1 Glycoside hydrolase family 17 protein [Dioscorea alata]
MKTRAFCRFSGQMSSSRWKICALLLVFFYSFTSGVYVGINIGTDMSNLPSPSEIVSILQHHGIKHVRLFDADHQMLYALANTGIEVMVGVPNGQILQIGESKTEAANWINKNIAAFVPATNITYIAVGDEVLTTIPNAALVLVPALQFLESALLAANLNFQVKVSSPHSMGVIQKSFPPSTATFNSTWNSVMVQYLQFLKNTGSSFMLNAQPYYGYTAGGGIFPLEYALFRMLNPNKQIVDPNTLFSYSNMFDAMVDAAYYSMEAVNFSAIPVIVTATGWPWFGGANEKDADVDNALAYNSNLIRHVLNGSGTPSQPSLPINTYISALFNEDLRSGAVSEKNWGLFFPNGTTVYSLNFGDVAELDTNSTGLVGVFCIALSSANRTALKEGLDWACGPGGANCSAIQPGQPCYDANDLVAIASYAFNDYYHRMQASGGTCNFGNTATITQVDPSHGSCIFAGSTGSNTSSGGSFSPPTSAFGPISPGNGGSTSQPTEFISLVLLSALLFFINL